MLNLSKKQLSSLDRWGLTCRERFDRIIASGFPGPRTSTRKLMLAHKCGPGTMADLIGRGERLLSPVLLLAQMIEPKKMTALTMVSSPNAIICRLPIQLIGAA
jgi:hypothetical protein